MDKQKRFIIALSLCMFVILAHAAYMSRFRKTPQESVGIRQPRAEETVTPAAGYEKHPRSYPGGTVSREKRAAYQEETVTIDKGIYRVILSNLGAGIKELSLLAYKGHEIKPLVMAASEENEPLVFDTEYISDEDGYAPWRLVENTGDIVIYEQEDADKKVTKTFSFDNSNYIIGLQLEIENKTGAPLNVRYRITGGHALVTDNQADNMHAGVDVKVRGKIHRKRPSDKNIRGEQIFDGQPAWASVRSRYACFVLKPEQPETAAFVGSIDNKKAWSGVILGPVVLGPGEVIVHNYTLYAGPNDSVLISKLGFLPKEILGYWVSGAIGQFLFRGVELSYNIFGNYGVGIVLLTLILGILMFPLTRKMLHSAKQTQKLQPEIERIKKEYKDKPDKINKETMALYKKHGINPVGGCLPLFLQMPIFLSLFQILPRSIELRGASFLWIKDLSATDSLFTFPFKLPIVGSSFNLLPILMALTTLVQQKLSHPGGEVNEQQRMMAFIMPVMLCFIFYNMPSCIVLYWFTSTLTTLLLQEVVLKSRKPA